MEADYSGDGNFTGSTNSLQQIVESQCSSTNYIVSIVGNGTNTFTLTFAGTTHAQYFVLSTTNVMDSVTNWLVLPDSTNTAAAGIWLYTFTNDGTARFFRAQAVAPCP